MTFSFFRKFSKRKKNIQVILPRQAGKATWYKKLEKIKGLPYDEFEINALFFGIYPDDK